MQTNEEVIMKKLMLMALIFSFTFAQYNTNGADNTVIMWGKYKWANPDEVEGYSIQERNSAVNEWFSKTNQADKSLMSSMFLYHYWTGAQEDVHVVNEFASVDVATQSVRDNAKINAIAFPDAEKRREAYLAQNKYFGNYHEDVHIFENHKALEKKRSGGFGETTVVTASVGYWKPMSEVENGSAAERYELMKKFQKEVIGKNPKILSQKVLTHLWSGKVEDGYWPVVTLSEYNSMEDADNAGDDNGPLALEAMTEEERNAYGKYWAPGRHDDIGLFNNWIPANK